MEAASGPHFSGLRLDGLLSSPSSGRSPALPLSSSSSSTLADSNGPKQPFVIGVSGGTASGKTTVCDMIIQQLHDHRVVLVNQDSFYRGLTAEEAKRVHEYNFDHPDAFDTEQFLECIEKLRCTQSVQVPIYDFKNHRRCSESFRQVNASDVIILEGILVFHDPRVRNLMNMKIFVDTAVGDGTLSKYDYGNLFYNVKHYGESRPPMYNLSNIPHNLPLFLSYGGQDALSDVRDVETLLDSLKLHDPDKLSVQYIKDYAHADFIIGVTAKDILYNQIISFFRHQL